MDALAQSWLDFANKQSTEAEKPKELDFKINVQRNGQIIIDEGYSEWGGYKYGDRFSIEFGYRCINLTKDKWLV